MTSETEKTIFDINKIKFVMAFNLVKNISEKPIDSNVQN